MFFRMVSLMVVMAIVGLMIVWSMSSDKSALQDIPAVQEQRKTLQQSTGVDAMDQKALEKYTLDQAKQLQDYQQQLQAPAGE